MTNPEEPTKEQLQERVTELEQQVQYLISYTQELKEKHYAKSYSSLRKLSVRKGYKVRKHQTEKGERYSLVHKETGEHYVAVESPQEEWERYFSAIDLIDYLELEPDVEE
jgi:hypothetical protein